MLDLLARTGRQTAVRAALAAGEPFEQPVPAAVVTLLRSLAAERS